LDANTVYYFFSSTAQVWAALVGFGGIAVRDRLKEAEKSRDILFDTTTAILAPMMGGIRSRYAGWELIENNIEARERFFDENPAIEQEIPTFLAISTSERHTYERAIKEVFENHDLSKMHSSDLIALRKDLAAIIGMGLVLIVTSLCIMPFAAPLLSCTPLLCTAFALTIVGSLPPFWWIYRSLVAGNPRISFLNYLRSRR